MSLDHLCQSMQNQILSHGAVTGKNPSALDIKQYFIASTKKPASPSTEISNTISLGHPEKSRKSSLSTISSTSTCCKSRKSFSSISSADAPLSSNHPSVSHSASPSYTTASTCSSSSGLHKQHRHFSYGTATGAAGYDLVLKVIMLGDVGAGKSSYLSALRVQPDVSRARCQCRVAHLCDHVELEVLSSSGKLALVKLCDTGGQERFRSLTSSYYRGAHGAILMSDLNHPRALENLEQWISDLDTFCSASSCSRVMLGSNCASTTRSVEAHTARDFAEQRAMPYMEIDSTHFYNVVESLQLCVDTIVRQVTVARSHGHVIKPRSRSEEELQRIRAKFVCLC